MDDKYTLLTDILFTGGTALAGLILVFIGTIITGYDSFDKVDKNAVHGKYKIRAYIALAGFLASLICVCLILIFIQCNNFLFLNYAVISFSLSIAIIIILSIISLKELLWH